MNVTVLIRPKPGILDPQGEAVRDSLAKLGLVTRAVRVGRLVEIELGDGDPEETRAAVERMCRDLLANPLIESFEILDRETRA